MNDLLDKLILRASFTFFLCFIIFLYRYLHFFLFEKINNLSQLKNNPISLKNPSYIIHLFARLIGISIIYSEQYFNLEYGILYSLLGFSLRSILSITLYLFSLYIIDGITLYNF